MSILRRVHAGSSVAPLFVSCVLACVAACAGPTKQPPARSASTADAVVDERERVALAGAATEPDLTYLAGDLTPAQVAEVARLAPNLHVVLNPTREQALELAPRVRGADARYASPEFLARATRLVWLQAMSAGVDRLVAQPAIREADGLVLTNMRGVHGPAIADHAFAMLLVLTRDLRGRLETKEKGRWSRESSGARPIALQGRTMLVVGLGGIGSEVAARARGFGMTVIATRRGDAPKLDGVEEVGKAEDLMRFLPRADVVAICVPLTKETERLFDARAFAAMKRGAILVNVARGRVVDTAAMVDALKSGRLGGACLDVTDPEPLPDDSPLWTMENVVVTPHVASDAEITDQRAWELLSENLRRFAAGEPLRNVVDKKAGY